MYKHAVIKWDGFRFKGCGGITRCPVAKVTAAVETLGITTVGVIIGIIKWDRQSGIVVWESKRGGDKGEKKEKGKKRTKEK